MAKRKLSLQQQRRIARQSERSQNSLRDNSAVKQADNTGLSQPKEGLIMTRYGKQARVLPLDFEQGAVAHRCHIRANVSDLVTGDKVIWRESDSIGVIESVLPRASLMSRPDNTGLLRPVAANVDRIAIVFAPEPRAHQNLIDRYLVAAEHLNITPLLVFNKSDLWDGNDPHLLRLLALYRQLGYELITISAKVDGDMSAFHHALNGHISVLVGQSGVGKTSILNKILPDINAVEGELSAVAKGKHTTTASTYYRLPQGGDLIDSPGIREFGLWHLSAEQIAEGFIDFRPYIGGCKFRDCQHFSEPGCRITHASEEGFIDPKRLSSYQHIVNDLNA